MKELRVEVQEVMQNELKRANEKFPLFNSGHEGISVIQEELFEAYEEIDCLTDATRDLERAVFKDRPVRELHSIARQGIISAVCAACELIQTAAMFDKFRTSIDQKKSDEEPKSDFMDIPQQEINRMVDEMSGTEEQISVKRKCLRLTPDQAKKVIEFLGGLEEEK